MPDIDSHLRYIGISAADVAALRRVRPVIEQHVDEFIQYFYDHLQAFEGTRSFITDPVVLNRLLTAQRRYVLNMFDARFDEEYYRYRCLIGHTHFRLGLDFKWYVGAYILYLDFFMPRIEETLHDKPLQIRQVQSAFQKVTMLDMSIVLEAYHRRDRETLADTNRQLLHQEKLATVGLLVSGLAHEIGNPLASIQAICENLLNKQLDPAVSEKLQRISSRVDTIVRIVSQLVTYARPAAPSWKKMDLKRVLDLSLEVARLSRNSKTVTVNLTAEDLPLIDAMEDQIGQVFVNLFLNAFDAMPETDGKLSIVAAYSDGYAVVTVEDNGCGISSDNLKKIYDPFFTTKDVGKGTGLGLHVSMNILHTHSGSIAATSELKRGTRFTVRLPVTQSTPAEATA